MDGWMGQFIPLRVMFSSILLQLLLAEVQTISVLQLVKRPFLVFFLAVGQLEGLFLKPENIPIPQIFTHFPKSLKLWIT